MPAAPAPARPVDARQSPWGGGALRVLVLATIASTLTAPGQTIGVSVFIDHFVDDLDLTRSQVSGAYLVGTLTGAALLPRVGRFIDQRGVRLAQLLIATGFGVALVNMSFVHGLVWLAVGFTGIRFLGQGSLSLVSTVTVAIRFRHNRGTAIGLFSTVSSALMALVPVVLAFVISQVGWRSAWLVSAAVVVAVVVPIAWFGLRDLPRGPDDVRPAAGDTADTADTVSGNVALEDPAGAAEPPEPAETVYDRGTAIRTRSFWVLAAMTASAGMLGTALNFHQIDLLGEAGLSKTAAAALFIPQVVGSTVAGLTIGFVSDRVGTRYLPAAGLALLVAAHWLAAVVSPGVVVLVYAVVLGAMGGAIRTTASTLLPDWFGTSHLGSIQGSLTFFNVGASALGPVALAVVQAGFGSYAPAALLLSAIPLAALVFSLLPGSGPPERATGVAHARG